MPVEHVTRTMDFDNLVVEVSVYRYICNACGQRECFHDVPTPYNQIVTTPSDRKWKLKFPPDGDGEQEAYCKNCEAR